MIRKDHPAAWLLFVFAAVSICCGCRGRQHAWILSSDDRDMIGSHEAGAETWKPLIEESVARLLGRCTDGIQTVSWIDGNGTGVRTVCFAGVENRSSEPLGDFREQIDDHIDTLVGQAPGFRIISRRYVEAALDEIRCRPDALIIPEKRRELQAVLERQDQPFDYLLFAHVTSGTTAVNGDYQRDYQLTLELLDIHTGESIRESALLRKGYHRSYLGRLKYRLAGSNSR